MSEIRQGLSERLIAALTESKGALLPAVEALLVSESGGMPLAEKRIARLIRSRELIYNSRQEERHTVTELRAEVARLTSQDEGRQSRIRELLLERDVLTREVAQWTRFAEGYRADLVRIAGERDAAIAERDAAEMTVTEDVRYVRRIESERDKAIAERDASRQVNAEFLASAHTEALHATSAHYRDAPMPEGVGE